MNHLKVCSALLIASLGAADAAAAQPDGGLDSLFGREQGLTAVAGGEFSTAHEVVPLDDGGWIMSGYVRETPGTKSPRYRASLSRFRADGTLDIAFGNHGTVLGPALGPVWATTAVRDGNRVYQVVAEQRATGAGQRLHAYAYTLDGHPLLTFGSGGVVTIAADIQTITATAVVQNGQLVIAAGGRDPTAPDAQRPMLIRLTATGQPDASFAGDGIAYYRAPEGLPGYFTDVTLYPDGRIVAIGETYTPASDLNLLAARFTEDGAIDMTFGSGGFRRLDLLVNDYAGGVRVRGDGKILVAATACDGTFNSNETCMPSVARLLGNGAFDLSFGGGAPVFHPVPAVQPGYARVNGLAEDAQGRLLLAGSIDDPLFSGYLMRLSPEGALDAGFGSHGTVVAPYREQGWVGEVETVQVTTVQVGGLSVPRLITVGRRQRAGGPESERVIARHLYSHGSTP
ncbi:MAG TPA: hypothetical protein VGD21_04205 [Lysobacter sp.]